jgi:aspartate-semialdehyde dehydrogenase
MQAISLASKDLLDNPASSILDLDKKVTDTMHGPSFPVESFGVPLAGSVIPWIDSAVENGQSKEEWKGFAETNKILQTKKPIPIDGLCVRIGAMRCHSQALTVKLTKNVPIDEITDIIRGSNEWVRVVNNTKEETVKQLTPSAITGTLTVPIGRIHKLNIGPDYMTAYTVGDQLLWGAAEPIRRILRIIIDHIKK